MPIDAPDFASSTNPSVIALASNVIAFAYHHHICGFADISGRELWCAGSGVMPASSDSAFAYANDSTATVTAVSAKSGAFLWRHRFQRLNGPLGANFSFFFVAPSARGTFVVGASSPNVSNVPGSTPKNYAELADGTVLWSRVICCTMQYPSIQSEYILQPAFASGAYIQYRIGEFRLATGQPVASIVDARAVLYSDKKRALLLADEQGPGSFLHVEVIDFDLRRGSIAARYHYEPDYAENYSKFVTGNSAAGGYSQQEPATDGKALYFAVASQLYRYQVASADSNPLRVSGNGTFVGGPRGGAVFIMRSDGLWALRPSATHIQAALIYPTTQAFAAIAFRGDMGYFATADGAIHGFDARNDRPLLDAAVKCRPWQLTVGARMLYVVCDKPTWQIAAFTR